MKLWARWFRIPFWQRVLGALAGWALGDRAGTWLHMMRTLTNVTDQMRVPILVAREEGLLDLAVYNRASSNVGLEEPPSPAA
ncbi:MULTISPECIES: hypothetical protein [Corallococcus]|uniref:hypothetical protein n=1 Tax=Corallococcus TaxID=83461 RepID=UPI001F3B9B43|nr:MULTISPECIES: hypothetical protein [Corallococcus]